MPAQLMWCLVSISMISSLEFSSIFSYSVFSTHLAYEHISVHIGFDFFRRNPPAAVELGFINWSSRSLPSTETTTTTTTTTIFCQSQSQRWFQLDSDYYSVPMFDSVKSDFSCLILVSGVDRSRNDSQSVYELENRNGIECQLIYIPMAAAR